MNYINAKTMVEMNDGIILANFDKEYKISETSYQSEAQLERRLIENLMAQGYDRLVLEPNVDSSVALYKNLRNQIEKLNKIKFIDEEWERFLTEYLDKYNDTMIEKTRKIQENHIYDFKFDNGIVKNIKIIDKEDISNNYLQVVNQVVAEGKSQNRYDVTILVNGLPLVHIELKRRGVDLHEAFNQIHRYSKESFNSGNSLYKFVQIFVISNGTYTRYFANTTAQNKNNYSFTCEWADAKNRCIRDLENFTKTFFERRVILELLTKYCVFDVNNTLLVMRPYQIAATERIIYKIKSSILSNKAGKVEAGGYIWHTTGSGKTLTSFKAAKLATEIKEIDKVFFVVDRKDLDYQTMKEYQRFQPDSVNGSKDTKELKKSIEKDDNRIVVTTIQKLNEFIKQNKVHSIYNKHCVLIFDECHRSQFGDAQKNIRKAFKKYYQFGFTGTPIFIENARRHDENETTKKVFGVELHNYVITDAFRDEKVLKFKVDYHNVNPKFEKDEKVDIKIQKKLENEALYHPERISKVVEHILKVYDTKTSRNQHYSIKDRRLKGFNAMFAVNSVRAAKLYYEEFEKQQKDLIEDKKLKVAMIYSYAANEEQNAIGEIEEESFDVSAIDSSAKEFLEKVIKDYNETFGTNFSINGNDFQNYYRDLSLKVKEKKVDLLIVVGMFLTGFDAPTLNTLFVDKSLKYHGLIQAYSRTNRILNTVKAFGNIVCFRNLDEATKEALVLFGDKDYLILEKGSESYLNGYKDEKTGQQMEGYIEISNKLLEKFSNPTEITLDSDKKEFCKLFGKFLRLENILRYYDEFENMENPISNRFKQDMKSVYITFMNEVIERKNREKENDQLDYYADVKFEVELVKSQEVDLNYVLSSILEKYKESGNKEILKEKIRAIIRENSSLREKEELVISFIDNIDLNNLNTKVEDIIEEFYNYAKEVKEIKIKKLIEEENLKEEATRFIEKSINRGYADYSGGELDRIIPPVSRIGGKRAKKKETVFDKITKIAKEFFGM